MYMCANGWSCGKWKELKRTQRERERELNEWTNDTIENVQHTNCFPYNLLEVCVCIYVLELCVFNTKIYELNGSQIITHGVCMYVCVRFCVCVCVSVSTLIFTFMDWIAEHTSVCVYPTAQVLIQINKNK